MRLESRGAWKRHEGRIGRAGRCTQLVRSHCLVRVAGYVVLMAALLSVGSAALAGVEVGASIGSPLSQAGSGTPLRIPTVTASVPASGSLGICTAGSWHEYTVVGTVSARHLVLGAGLEYRHRGLGAGWLEARAQVTPAIVVNRWRAPGLDRVKARGGLGFGVGVSIRTHRIAAVGVDVKRYLSGGETIYFDHMPPYQLSGMRTTSLEFGIRLRFE